MYQITYVTIVSKHKKNHIYYFVQKIFLVSKCVTHFYIKYTFVDKNIYYFLKVFFCIIFCEEGKNTPKCTFCIFPFFVPAVLVVSFHGQDRREPNMCVKVFVYFCNVLLWGRLPQCGRLLASVLRQCGRLLVYVLRQCVRRLASVLREAIS